jgi:hypothetical protein
MRFVILHYHIFKNAGSTVEDILDHSFGDRFGRLDTPSDAGLIGNPELLRYLDDRPQLRAFSSHQIRYPVPEAPGYFFFDICFLRDPLDRVRSFYDYFRQRPNPGDPMSALANSGSLGDFVAGSIAEHSLFIRNNQVNLLACAGDSDEPNEADLELATRRMLATSFLGVVDCFEQSAAAGTEALHAAFPELDCARPPVNVSRGLQGTVADRTGALRDACRPEVYEELLRITALDRELVDRARAEVLRRLKGVPAVGVGRRKRLPHRPTYTKRSVPGLARLVKLAPFWKELAGSGCAALFDGEYYGGSLLDFLLRGGYDGQQPHPLFDPAFYLRKYPDVAAAGVNPLCHYLKYGRAQLRQPHPLFDSAFYLDRNPDVRSAGVDPLLHYLHDGAAEGRKPHPLFDPAYYRATGGKLRVGENPLVHFLCRGADARSPHPLFDCDAYVNAHPDVAEQDLKPRVHYVKSRSKVPDQGAEEATVRLDIIDEPLLVSFGAGPGDKREGLAVMWEDVKGVTHWVAEPQQLPFLRVVSASQIRAQI